VAVWEHSPLEHCGWEVNYGYAGSSVLHIAEYIFLTAIHKLRVFILFTTAEAARGECRHLSRA
jgi:hypothetical protein